MTVNARSCNISHAVTAPRDTIEIQCWHESFKRSPWFEEPQLPGLVTSTMQLQHQKNSLLKYSADTNENLFLIIILPLSNFQGLETFEPGRKCNYHACRLAALKVFFLFFYSFFYFFPLFLFFFYFFYLFIYKRATAEMHP